MTSPSYQPGDRVYAAQIDPHAPRTVTGIVLKHPDGTVTYRVRDREGRSLPLHENLLRPYDPPQAVRPACQFADQATAARPSAAETPGTIASVSAFGWGS